MYKIGDKVDYHFVAGGAITSYGHEVVGIDPGGRIWIRGKPYYILEKHLTPSKPPERAALETTPQMDLFAQRQTPETDRDVETLLRYLSDGLPHTRETIASALGWTERHVRDIAAMSQGRVARAPGVPGYRLTALCPVEEWQRTYGAAWDSTIRKQAHERAAQIRVLYGKKKV
jgi:hypothetical protein